MKIPGASDEAKTIHEALKTPHDWFWISANYLRKFEKCVSNDRRVCLLCGRVEFMYHRGWDDEEDIWYAETSALATNAILIALKEKKEVLCSEG